MWVPPVKGETNAFYRQHFERLSTQSTSFSTRPTYEIPSFTGTLADTPRIRWNSKALGSLKRKEKSWNDRFSVKFSKDNSKHPRGQREYFDFLILSPHEKDFNVSYGPSVPASRASTSHSVRPPRSSTPWSLRDTKADYNWRTISPVAFKQNQQNHPWRRKYFTREGSAN
jgi:hypothetical protein